MQSAVSTRTYHILSVGDSPDLDAILAAPFDGGDTKIESVARLEEAVELLGTDAYDVVLVDLDDISSQDVGCVRKLRRARADTKVILLVSRSTPEQVIEAIRAHAFSYFSRPLDRDAVRDMLLHAFKIRWWSDGIELLSAAPEFLTLRLRCRLHTADRLLRFMKEIGLDLSDEDRDELGQAFRELLLNAMEHGGKLDPNEWVRVSRVRTRRTIVYYILDPGEGFARDELPHAADPNADPLAHVEHREQLGLRPGGFGLLIAKSLVDEVIYNQQGNEVILIKHLE